MGAIAAHLRYIAKGGRLPFEDDRGVVREGKEALRAVVDQWRVGGSCIPERSERREAFNVMLSMPRGTEERFVLQAAREFAKAELAKHRYVMVLHTHQANPHVHISVRAEGREGTRLNPRKEDLRRWRETFAERLRGWGIEAEASPQTTRGERHRNERVWTRKRGRALEPGSSTTARPSRVAPSHVRAAEAWARIAQALAASPQPSDRELSQAIVRYVRDAPAMRALMQQRALQRELPGMNRTPTSGDAQVRRGPEIER